jgi:hypothetical protein
MAKGDIGEVKAASDHEVFHGAFPRAFHGAFTSAMAGKLKRAPYPKVSPSTELILPTLYSTLQRLKSWS